MNQLKELRKQNSLTQKELAKKIGVATTTIASYEQGHRKMSVPIAVKLGGALNTHWTIFFEDEVRTSYSKKNKEENE